MAQEEIFNDGILSVCILLEGSLCIMILGGRMENDSVYGFADLLKKKANFKNETRLNFIIDVESLNYISSAGIRMILTMKAMKKDFFMMSRMMDKVDKVIRNMGLNTMIDSFESLSEAIDRSGISTELVTWAIDRKLGINLPNYSVREYSIIYGAVGGEAPIPNILKQMYSRVPHFNIASESIVLPAEKVFSAFLYKYFCFLFKARAHLFDGEIYGENRFSDEIAEFIALELMNNSIIHGYGGAKNSYVMMKYSISPDNHLTIRFIDFGKGFTRDVVDMDVAAIKKQSGLPMIKKYFDKITITSPVSEPPPPDRPDLKPGKGTMITLVKNLKSAAHT